MFSAASAASTAGELAKQIASAGSRVLVTSEATRGVAVRAAEEAGWGTGGGGRVVVMSEGEEWELRVVNGEGGLGANLVDEGRVLDWERVTDRKTLEESLVVLIYSSGTTGLPKGMYPLSPPYPTLHIPPSLSRSLSRSRRRDVVCIPSPD